MPEANYKLFFSGLPVIENLTALSDCTHLSEELLYKLSTINNYYYKDFKKPKKTGGSRNIACPSKKMKAIQSWILRNILDKIHVSKYATGFRPGKNLLFNLSPHQENRYFLCLDIDDFFPSIPYAKVYNAFRIIGYKKHVSHILASICTYKASLPQGGVTSPALSNIICISLDHRIAGYTGMRNIAFTRYADDITLSCMSPSRLIGAKKIVEKIINEEGFKLNQGKTRFIGPRAQCKITGLVISHNGSVSIGRKRKRTLRANIHRLLSGDLAKKDYQKLQSYIHGWLAFLNDVDKIGLKQLEIYIKNRKIKYKSKTSLGKNQH